ncbi:MAG: sulfite exporter TauE/SafE family protein [Thermoplasmata archaeon]|nr:sulfite exporter TauE/SafE family protein [Thermoplasmata archaeon]
MGLSVLALGGGLPPVLVLAVLVGISILAGALGSLLGLGGGLVLVPALVLLFGVDIHLAIAASLVSVIATSCGTSASQVEEGLTEEQLLAFIPVVLVAAFLMFRNRQSHVSADPPHDEWADRLRLHGTFYNERRGQSVSYRVTGTREGLALAGVAGVGSGLLGIGGGIFNVPAMNAFMNVPMRVATATSTFMIGVTAAAGAMIYLFAGDVSLVIAAPVCVGVLVGTQLGIRYQWRTSSSLLKLGFVVILFAAAILMGAQGLGWLH